MNKEYSIILKTDSYKLASHWNMFPEGTEGVYSYFESRTGAKYKETVFFGLQYILKKYFEGSVVTEDSIKDAAEICKFHIGDELAFNKQGWEYILNKHGGRLPIVIKAVPEGISVPESNVLFTIENTDPKCFWLPGYLESILTHVFGSCTVATLAKECKKILKQYLELSSDSILGLDFMLHCFGYRSTSSEESAAILGCANLTQFRGTDTVPALITARNYYNADLSNLAFSVPATEHSLTTSYGPEGESRFIGEIFDKYPKGIISLVADQYNYYNFISNIIGKSYKETILNRDGITVVRPDSITNVHKTPEDLTLWTIQELWNIFGGVINSKGHKVLNSKLKILWGDGIDINGIEKILKNISCEGFSVESLVFGMGGNYLQKGINRDLQKFAFKSSAQKRNGVWYDIGKDPLDQSKKSKKGRLKLAKTSEGFITVPESSPLEDQLVEVFRDGKIVKEYNFTEIRENAKLSS